MPQILSTTQDRKQEEPAQKIVTIVELYPITIENRQIKEQAKA